MLFYVKKARRLLNIHFLLYRKVVALCPLFHYNESDVDLTSLVLIRAEAEGEVPPRWELVGCVCGKFVYL